MQAKIETPALPPIAIQPAEWEELAAILKAHLRGRSVWAFGSRATGRRVKRFSDLDLLIDGPELTLLEEALLREALDESKLSFKVDIAQLESLTPAFRSGIEAERVQLQSASSV